AGLCCNIALVTTLMAARFRALPWQRAWKSAPAVLCAIPEQDERATLDPGRVPSRTVESEQSLDSISASDPGAAEEKYDESLCDILSGCTGMSVADPRCAEIPMRHREGGGDAPQVAAISTCKAMHRGVLCLKPDYSTPGRGWPCVCCVDSGHLLMLGLSQRVASRRTIAEAPLESLDLLLEMRLADVRIKVVQDAAFAASVTARPPCAGAGGTWGNTASWNSFLLSHRLSDQDDVVCVASDESERNEWIAVLVQRDVLVQLVADKHQG
ncbi:MAG: hypothetical protein ACPIOQ_47750, partial [Promethearchaeia archaeon]